MGPSNGLTQKGVTELGQRRATPFDVLLRPDHYRNGFHATGTIGAPCAAAGLVMLALDEHPTTMALGSLPQRWRACGSTSGPT
jgi:hypothetical protein